MHLHKAPSIKPHHRSLRERPNAQSTQRLIADAHKADLGSPCAGTIKFSFIRCVDAPTIPAI
jgi:hypothetical protein